MPIIKTLVTKEQKEEFIKIAKSQGLSESELLRQVLHAVINKEERESPEKIKPITEEGNVEIKRLTIRIPVFLFDISKERAGHKGMAISRWVVSLIQSNLMNQPVMSGDELRELRGSIRELSAIGRNINQMTRSLNENFFETERVRLDQLSVLSKIITRNKKAIQSLVIASKQEWGANNGAD